MNKVLKLDSVLWSLEPKEDVYREANAHLKVFLLKEGFEARGTSECRALLVALAGALQDHVDRVGYSHLTLIGAASALLDFTLDFTVTRMVNEGMIDPADFKHKWVSPSQPTGEKQEE